MKFDKSNVYTALNADELEEGDVVFAADTLADLRKFNLECVNIISCIVSDEYMHRFKVTSGSRWGLAYLIAKRDDPYKELKKAQAEGREVWLNDGLGNWSSNKTNCQDWLFHDSPKNYSLTKPEETEKQVSWEDFKLLDKVEYNGIQQFVSAIMPNGSNIHICFSRSDWVQDGNLKAVKRLED